MAAIPPTDTSTRAQAREDIDKRLEALLTSLNADTPNNPTAKNFGQDELRGIREYVKRSAQEGLPILNSSQMTELLAQAQEGTNIRPLDPKAQLRPDDVRTRYEPETGAVAAVEPTSIAKAIAALGAMDTVRGGVNVSNDAFALGRPDTPAQERERAEVLTR